MNEELGCLFFTVLGAGLVASICVMAGRDGGQDAAHDEYVRCLGVRTTAQADSIAIKLRPECQKWLQPGTAK